MKEEIALLAEMEKYAILNRIPILHSDSRAILTALIQENKPRIILEIGTAIGYSTLLMALNMSEETKIFSIEKDEYRAQLACNYIMQTKFTKQIIILTGDAGEILQDLPFPDKIDMVFIDAAKGQYLDYLMKISGQLAAHAVVVADNVLFRGMVEGIAPQRRYRTIVKRMQEYLQFVNSNNRFQTVLERSGDGMAISYYQGDI